MYRLPNVQKISPGWASRPSLERTQGAREKLSPLAPLTLQAFSGSDLISLLMTAIWPSPPVARQPRVDRTHAAAARFVSSLPGSASHLLHRRRCQPPGHAIA